MQDQIHVKEEGKQGGRIAPSLSFVVKHPFFLLSTKKGSPSSRPCLFPQRATSPHHSQQWGPCFSFRKFSVIFQARGDRAQKWFPGASPVTVSISFSCLSTPTVLQTIPSA